jgi:hypothetical protein
MDINEMINNKFEKLEKNIENYNNNYEILYKKNDFLNKKYKLNNEIKKILKISKYDNNNYSLNDIYKLFIKKLKIDKNNNFIINEDFKILFEIKDDFINIETLIKKIKILLI